MAMIRSKAHARAIGYDDGEESVEVACRENGTQVVAVWSADGWDDNAINAGVASIRGVPARWKRAYYQGYAAGARSAHAETCRAVTICAE